jgi:hypothetical protein
MMNFQSKTAMTTADMQTLQNTAAAHRLVAFRSWKSVPRAEAKRPNPYFMPHVLAFGFVWASNYACTMQRCPQPRVTERGAACGHG